MSVIDDFGELRLLLIEGSNLSYWIAADNIFPKLECLILLDCPNLLGIPSEIGDIPTLDLIEVATAGKSKKRYKRVAAITKSQLSNSYQRTIVICTFQVIDS